MAGHDSADAVRTKLDLSDIGVLEPPRFQARQKIDRLHYWLLKLSEL
jgi:hypothetical protein